MNTLITSTKSITKILQPSVYVSLFLTSPSSSKPHRHHHFGAMALAVGGGGGEKASVWWDMDDCGVPSGVSVIKTTHTIIDALRINGIMGPLQITAFGHIPNSNHLLLSSAGVNLLHIPNPNPNPDGGTEEESVEQSVIVNLRNWVSSNPPPAHIFLISGDERFADKLHELRKRNYNILLASRERRECRLSSAASIMWQWDELAKGENLLGKKKQQDHPLCTSDRQKNIDDSSNALDYEHRRIPNAVIDLVERIVWAHAHPEGGGVSIAEFKNELEMSDVVVDYDAFYGDGTLL